MPTITVQSIIDRAETILQDTSNTRWAVAELLNWFNDGQREIVLRKPDAYTTQAALALTAGTRQSIPATGIQLIDIPRNLGADGATPGRAITTIPRDVLDGSIRNWHSSTAASTIQHFCFDERQPKSFFVYPPAVVGTNVEIVYAVAPAEILIGDIDGATMTLDDIYANALLDYILFRAYLKDSDAVGNSQRAMAHFNLFLNALGAKENVETDGEPI